MFAEDYCNIKKDVSERESRLPEVHAKTVLHEEEPWIHRTVATFVRTDGIEVRVCRREKESSGWRSKREVEKDGSVASLKDFPVIAAEV